jgi:hypothetical protein
MAQPILDAANSAPQPGQSYTINQGLYQPPPVGGAAQVWDFSTLATQGSALVELVAPAGTASAASFPTSDVVETSVASAQLRYFENSPLGLILLGYSAPSQGFLLPFSPPIMARPYPCTFDNEWSGTYGGSTTFQGFNVLVSGSYEGEADGYGTVVMPWGTVENVLRTRLLLTETQLFIGAGQSVNQQETWDFHAPGSSYPLIRFSERRTQNQGGEFDVDTQSLLWMGNSTTAVHGHEEAGMLSIFPNPATEAVTISTTERIEDLRVMDATGRQVKALRPMGTTSAVYTLDLNGLAAGAYTVQVQLVNGQLAVSKLVVEGR